MNIVKRVDVAAKLYEQALLPIFNHADISVCKKIVTACYKGGQRIMEYTNRGNYAPEVYLELRKFVSENCPGMYFGVGTIIDAPTAIQFIQMGADFIVSPILNQEMAKVCNRRKVLWIPGCG
ncbi:MAG: bifunctional 4-hydroxy-2-oxoglutarate aldolase/2-dehydro-3-deoxy-phosphogluconate aldolase, partial [Bacteroidales bacterium]|nr:bifunctional 4-hydroxy-2-oxoglutarate aldolase/2-dehydro-3-deoxy-phosphogluconate aldolase [Bacteroidales bacterium]